MLYLLTGCCLLLTEVSTESNECWPLHDEQTAMIDKNRLKLIKLLDTEYDLLPDMKATTCLTIEQIDSLRSIPDERVRNGKLLQMLKRRSFSQFSEFIKCLGKYQRHLIPFLTGDEGNQVSVSSSLSFSEFHLHVNFPTYAIN